jgi:hypothetical protein
VDASVTMMLQPTLINLMDLLAAVVAGNYIYKRIAHKLTNIKMDLHISIPKDKNDEIHEIVYDNSDRDSTIFCVAFGMVWIFLLYNAYLA